MRYHLSFLVLLLGGCFLFSACGESGSSSESCTDGVKNQNETGTDCGGICSKCPDGQGCLVDSDCSSGNCSAGTCSSGGATCNDNVQNQDETDVDCGGSNCQGCTEGKRCSEDADCEGSLTCKDGNCTSQCVPDCEGKCGGASDGCNGTCTDCPAGQWCDAQSCLICNTDSHCGDSCTDCTGQDSNKACINGACGCALPSDCKGSEICRNGECLELIDCAFDADCPAGQWCDDSNGICAPCDSNDHCGASCKNCSAQSRDKVCIDEACGCSDDTNCAQGETCQQGQCHCTDSDLICDGNTVRICSAGVWNDLIDCTVSGQVCIGSECQEGIACTVDEDCAMYNMVCDNGHCSPKPCTVDMECSFDEHCQDGVCTCNEGFVGCHNNMVQECMGSSWNVLEDCYEQGLTCIDGQCRVNQVCPEGQQCLSSTFTQNQKSCLQDGLPPWGSQTGCDLSDPVFSCPANSLCYDTGIPGEATICLERCGLCPGAQQCTNIIPDDPEHALYLCLGPDGAVPPDAQTGCVMDDPTSCEGNAMCVCLSGDCTDTVCLFNCSAPH